MDKDTIQQLEQQVDELLRVSRRLHDENTLLKKQKADWTTERVQLIHKTELARSRIDKMVDRLKQLDDEL